MNVIENLSLKRECPNTTKIRGIYKIINKTNKKYYVGSSSDIFRRWKWHIRDLRCNRHHNDHLQAAWNKYGQKTFELFIVQRVEKTEKLLQVENQFLAIARNEPLKSYNLRYEATGRGTFSLYSRKKLSEAHKGKIASLETRKKISAMLSQRYKNPLARRIMSYAIKGRKLSSKTKMAISKTRKTQYALLNDNQKLSEINKIKIPIKLFNKYTHQTFNGLRYDFIKQFNMNSGNVCQLINGQKKSVLGWTLTI